MKTMIFISHYQNIQLGIPSCKNIKDVKDILCYTKPGDNAANWKIVLPKDLIAPTIRWYHLVTGHPGCKGLY
jgi:hypothetical protein